MSGWDTGILTLAAAGVICTVAETLLPRSGTRSAAQAAIGVTFLALLAEQIAGILL
ncbi:MAG: hypothetical protein IJJ86_03135 [Clostridia bacterium]|nr:hypothetical protein [Clostridia bacterium]